MNENQKNIKISDIESAIKSRKGLPDLMIRLKNEHSVDEDVLIVKDFLEKHNYDSGALINYFNPTNGEFDGLIEKHNSSKRLPVLRIAAVLLPIIGIGLLWNLSKTSKTDALYNKYFEVELGIPVTMALHNDVEFYNAMNRYRAEEYIVAFEAFKTLHIDTSANDTLLYYMGCSMLNLGDYEEAIELFLQIEDSSEYYEKGTTYIALSFIKLDRIKDAKSTLLLIPKNEIAKSLLDESIFLNIE